MFHTWVFRQARVTDCPAGDLILDLRRDWERLPDTFNDLAQFLSWLNCRGACPEALEAASIVWRRYECSGLRT